MQSKVQKTSLVGGLVAAAFASACCIAPVVFGILGLTSVSFISQFEQFRPYLIGLTLTFLAIAIYFTYRKKSGCDEEEVCESPRSDRLNKVVLWCVALIATSFLFAPTIMGWIL